MNSVVSVLALTVSRLLAHISQWADSGGKKVYLRHEWPTARHFSKTGTVFLMCVLQGMLAACSAKSMDAERLAEVLARTQTLHLLCSAKDYMPVLVTTSRRRKDQSYVQEVGFQNDPVISLAQYFLSAVGVSSNMNATCPYVEQERRRDALSREYERHPGLMIERLQERFHSGVVFTLETQVFHSTEADRGRPWRKHEPAWRKLEYAAEARLVDLSKSEVLWTARCWVATPSWFFLGSSGSPVFLEWTEKVRGKAYSQWGKWERSRIATSQWNVAEQCAYQLTYLFRGQNYPELEGLSSY